MPPLGDADHRARPDVWHPLVREHPQSGRKALFIGRWAVEVEGLPAGEGRDLPFCGAVRSEAVPVD